MYQDILEGVLNEFWNYYQMLREYSIKPDMDKKKDLEDRFEQIFQRKTGYSDLDNRLNSIAGNKSKLLLVLDYPDIPLHNNAAELGARAQVRRRDVSLHTITPEGTSAVDTFLTITQTAIKLGVSFYDYLRDRITKANKIERLAITLLNKAGRPDLIDNIFGDHTGDHTVS